MATSVAAGTPEPLKGGAMSAAAAWAPRAARSSLEGNLADGRWGTLQKVPLPFCYADIVNPFPAALIIAAPGATGYAASPVLPSLQK